ncbi:hypothetical protein Scani_50360 [Streptomyces caniferus]|uniref:Uncharacterized protein n=1 Tax=Streptomyces caniferus TaxID=285557 RepID=A0A640SCJ8_9ACTN|nr:hypothetical protein Scani_50360 [Streptomyces caniferus]
MSVPYLRWGAPSAANRLTWHSLRIDGSLCAEAAHASAAGLPVAGAIAAAGTGKPAPGVPASAPGAQ